MTRTTVLFASQAAGIALALSNSLAHAAAGARLFYQAPEGCPSQAAFVAAVHGRGASFEPGPEGMQVRLLLVALRAEPSGFSGTLELRRGSQTSAPRAVHGASCAEVSDALAVVTAIALQESPEPEVVSDPQPVAAVAQSVEALAPAIPAAPPSPPAPREHPTHVVMWKDDVQVEAGKLSFGYQPGYTLTAGAALGVIPHLTLPRIDLTLSRGNIVTTPGKDDYLVGGVVRVRWTILAPSSYRAVDYSTRLWGLKAGFGGCTPFSYDPSGLTVKACSEVAAGVMSLDTKDAGGIRTQQKLTGIGTFGFELNSQYNLGSLVHLELLLGGEMWLTKLTAERPDGSRLFHSSLFNAYATAGIGVHF